MEVIDKMVLMLFISSAIFMTIVICVFNKNPSKKLGGDWLKAWLERLKKNKKD